MSQINLRQVLLIVHPSKADAQGSVDPIVQWLGGQGVGAHVLNLADYSETDDLAARLPDLAGIAELGGIGGLDLAVSLGGDGCMLRAVRMVGDHDVPVLGVNYGRLGYLSEVEADGVLAALGQVRAGECDIQERMRLSVELRRAGGGGEALGDVLNEVVLEKSQSGHTIRLAVSIDGEFFTTYAADGIIVATPTGSTAYSMSARGPIVAPSTEAILFTPVSPHMIFDRPLILSPDAEVRLEVLPNRLAETATDGRRRPDLEPGDVLICRRSEHPARLVTFSNRLFFEVLKQKFMLSDRVAGGE